MKIIESDLVRQVSRRATRLDKMLAQWSANEKTMLDYTRYLLEPLKELYREKQQEPDKVSELVEDARALGWIPNYRGSVLDEQIADIMRQFFDAEIPEERARKQLRDMTGTEPRDYAP